MAKIVLGSYMVRYPLGGMLSCVLQYLVGFQKLGHDVHFVEKSGYPGSCYDPSRGASGDDCSYGTRVVSELLDRFALGNRWCYVDAGGGYHGMDRTRVEAALREADVFVDMDTHGAWHEETGANTRLVLVDGEPGFTQIKRARALAAGGTPPRFDFFFTTGRNVGTGKGIAPATGEVWRPIFHPVVLDLFPPQPVPPAAPFTTVMNWQSYERLQHDGRTYGHKDLEFERFMGLPRLVAPAMEVAVSGRTVPVDRLAANGWRLRSAQQVTTSFDSFRSYLATSCGEFSVCKHGFVAMHTGWFSDRSAAYLASMRPVVMQDTGFSDHLPCGEGLFAVNDADEAAVALSEIQRHPERNQRAALEIAREHLDATKVLAGLLEEVGIR